MTVEINHPNFSGEYTYEITHKSQWFRNLALYQDGNKVATLNMQDYSEADFMVHKFKRNTLFIFEERGGSVGVSLKEEQIGFK